MVKRRQNTRHFFWLRKVILSFFEEQLRDSAGNFHFQAQLQSTEFLCGLVFLTDITTHLNMVNLSLEVKGKVPYFSFGRIC